MMMMMENSFYGNCPVNFLNVSFHAKLTVGCQTIFLSFQSIFCVCESSYQNIKLLLSLAFHIFLSLVGKTKTNLTPASTLSDFSNVEILPTDEALLSYSHTKM